MVRVAGFEPAPTPSKGVRLNQTFLYPVISLLIAHCNMLVNYFFGADSENRTHDQSLTRRLHYHCATSAFYLDQLFAVTMLLLHYPAIFNLVAGLGFAPRPIVYDTKAILLL